MAWYSHFLKNFPQFIVIHRVKGFKIVNEAEVDVFLEFSCFFYNPRDFGKYVLVCTRFCLSPRAFLAVMRFELKCDFSPPAVFLEFLLCAWT